VQAFVVTVPADDSEWAADVLWSHGVLAVEERSIRGSTAVELWTSFGDGVDTTGVIGGLPTSCSVRFVEVDDAVVNTWREFAEPTWVEPDLVICPSWKAFDPPTTVTVLRIEPGVTFGMGDHPTTQLTMRALRRVVQPGDRVLDVGCGSGVLAIAAVVFGAAHAYGIDIAPAAVPVTTANAAMNGVNVSVSNDPLALVDGIYDIVLANILAPTLIDLAEDLRRVVRPGGTLIISGILADNHQHVLEALVPLQHVETIELDGWVAVTFQ
jgi:ribosomal protein L11 methyltransferase